MRIRARGCDHMSNLRLNFLALTAVLLLGGQIATAFAEEEQSVSASEATSGGSPQDSLILNRPRSLDSLIDERRDALRDRREAFHDSMRKFYGVYSPWMDYERDVWRTYSDQMQNIYRAHRDAMNFYHDQRRRYLMPWAAAFTEAAEARRFALAMESLDRQ